MTITYPRALPSLRYGVLKFAIQRNDLNAPENRGSVGGVQLGWPLWMAEYEITGLSDLEVREAEAWLASMRGSIKTFLASDLRREFPGAYPTGWGAAVRHGTATPFPGTASSWSVSGDRDELTLTGFPSTFVITPGDHVSFLWTPGGQARRGLVMATELAVAVNGVVTFAIEPALPLVVPDGALTNILRADCIMRVTSYQFAESDPEGEGTIRFSALQDLRA